MEFKHSYLKGMNRDLSLDKFSPDAYYYLLNGRILTDEDATLSDIINLKGNERLQFSNTPPNRTGFIIIGYTEINENLILFYAEENQDTDSYTSIACIDFYEYTGNDTYSVFELFNGQGLNFRVDKKIRAIGKEISNTLSKVYWVDDNNSIKHIIIERYEPAPNSHAYRLTTSDVDEMDIIGNMSYQQPPKFSEYTSGSLKSGIIFYAYRLLKKNSYTSIFSGLSRPIILGRDIDYGINIIKYKGDPVYSDLFSYNSGKGIKGYIPITNNFPIEYYDYIEVVSLWQSNKDITPDITIVSRIEIGNGASAYYFTDEGTSNYGTLTLAEFLNQKNTFSAKDIVLKDNRLFVANIKEKYFDLDENLGYYWDSRAYRFDSNQRCELLDALESVQYVITGTSPDYAMISKTATCLNPYNRNTEGYVDAESSQSTLQKYQADGVTLGGEGLNIEYSFYTGNYDLVNFDSTYPTMNGSVNNETLTGYYKGFQLDETYRFGIVFFDKKGRQSFVKWIGDIRTPTIEDIGGLTSYNTTSNEVTQKVTYISFTLKNVPQIDGVPLDWEIVRVKRENSDKSVIASGILNGIMNRDSQLLRWRPSPMLTRIKQYGTTIDTGSSGDKHNIKTDFINFFSPDVNFRNKEFLHGTYIETVGRHLDYDSRKHMLDENSIFENWYATTADAIDGKKMVVVRVVELLPTVHKGKVTIKAEHKSTLTYSSNFTTVINNHNYIHTTDFDYGADTIMTQHGTCMTYYLDNPVPNVSVSTEDGYYHAYLRKNVWKSQYGGYSYEDRALNTYIPASLRVPGEDNYVVAHGDMFTTIFEYNMLSSKMDYGFNVSSYWVYFPVQSEINCLLRHDDPFYKHWTTGGINAAQNIGEEEYVDSDMGYVFKALYQYNDAYSSEATWRTYFTKPLLFENIKEFSTKINYSDKSYYNEYSDNLIVFRSNNYNETNKNYGQINRIVEFMDKIFSFQDRAVSLVSVNPRVTQQSQDGVSVILGTGEVIDSFYYLTTDIGCQDNSDIIKSMSAMYWLDKNKKKIYTYNGKIESITDLKGMHSYLKKNITENSYFIGTYDIKNSEVLFTVYDDNPNNEFLVRDGINDVYSFSGILELLDIPFVEGRVYNILDGWYRFDYAGSDVLYFTYSHGYRIPDHTYVDLHTLISERDNFTICYNEKLQAFTSFYSFVPSLYIQHVKGFMSSDNTRDLWQHNKGRYNHFYNRAYPLILKLITNYSAQLQGEYTNAKVFMTVKDLDDEYRRNYFLTNIYCKNEYQITNDILLIPMHLANDTDRTKYVLDTSSDRIGIDWYNGITIPNEGLTIYENTLYRNISGGDLTSIPTNDGINWVVAELANVRKTIEHWYLQMPRYIRANTNDEVYDHENITSDRLRSNWLETTLIFENLPYSEDISNYGLKISDIIMLSNPMMF